MHPAQKTERESGKSEVGTGKATAVVNISGEKKTITLPYAGKDLITGEATNTTLNLSPYEVRIVMQK
jgi:beta-galactosidase GanA